MTTCRLNSDHVATSLLKSLNSSPPAPELTATTAALSSGGSSSRSQQAQHLERRRDFVIDGDLMLNDSVSLVKMVNDSGFHGWLMIISRGYLVGGLYLFDGE